MMSKLNILFLMLTLVILFSAYAFVFESGIGSLISVIILSGCMYAVYKGKKWGFYVVAVIAGLNILLAILSFTFVMTDPSMYDEVAYGLPGEVYTAATLIGLAFQGTIVYLAIDLAKKTPKKGKKSRKKSRK
jgi:hypothetical protein